jgi:hypothetical protein
MSAEELPPDCEATESRQLPARVPFSFSFAMSNWLLATLIA